MSRLCAWQCFVVYYDCEWSFWSLEHCSICVCPCCDKRLLVQTQRRNQHFRCCVVGLTVPCVVIPHSFAHLPSPCLCALVHSSAGRSTLNLGLVAMRFCLPCPLRNVPVSSVTTFGAFVELSPGCEGLVHISELDHGFIPDASQVVKVRDVL